MPKGPLFSPRRAVLLGRLAALTLAAMVVGCSSNKDTGDSCTPDDADGFVGGPVTILLTVDDTAFSRTSLTYENLSNVTMTLTNMGTKPHDFTVSCLATPNNLGCPTKSCFTGANIPALDPGASATVMYTLPLVEGDYPYRSDLPGDEALTGDFNLD
jgi:hypothetical protein